MSVLHRPRGVSGVQEEEEEEAEGGRGGGWGNDNNDDKKEEKNKELTGDEEKMKQNTYPLDLT